MAADANKHLWLRALGPNEMPAEITVAGNAFRHARTYKHDFFAATGLYEGDAGKVILKLGRQASLLGIPMRWLGRLLATREADLYEAVHDLEGIPQFLGIFDDTGLVHEFVEGHPLQPKEQVSDGFFARLENLIDAIHGRSIAYVDLEKRENILVTKDGHPCLIDFQISFRWKSAPPREGICRLLPSELGEFILQRLQEGDRYHLKKHQRRHRPDEMTPDMLEQSYRRGFWGNLYRRVSRPMTLTRRAILKRLTGRSRSPKQEGAEFLN